MDLSFRGLSEAPNYRDAWVTPRRSVSAFDGRNPRTEWRHLEPLTPIVPTLPPLRCDAARLPGRSA